MTILYAFPGLPARGRAFGAALLAMAARHAWDPNAICAVMSRESGFNPAAVNPASGATGLIQFMAATARGLGTTTAALRVMTAEQQLAYVERYYVNAFGSRIPPTVGDYYVATFMPSFIGQPPAAVIFRKGETGYTQNAGLDADKDGAIQVRDVTRLVEETYAAAKARGPVQYPGGGALPGGPFPTQPTAGEPGAASGGTGVDVAPEPPIPSPQEAGQARLESAIATLSAKVDQMIARVEAGITRAEDLVDRQLAVTTRLDQLEDRLERLEHQHALNHPSHPAGAPA